MLFKNHTPILGWKHQMIYQYCNIMALMNRLAHPSILRRKRRGIQPQGIKWILALVVKWKCISFKFKRCCFEDLLTDQEINLSSITEKELPAIGGSIC